MKRGTPLSAPAKSHCALCGCCSQRPCRTTGLASGKPVIGHTAHGVPIYACTRRGDRCSDCQRCHDCGDPIGARPQLLLIDHRKIRLCAGCALRSTGIALLDALLEAMACSGDPAVVTARANRFFGTALPARRMS